MKIWTLLLSLTLFSQTTGVCETSKLWGVSGEQWSPTSRLPDFSCAGYHSGKKSIPDLPIKGNVKEFGAVGDGVADDTDAFLKALESMNDGALFVPAGRYQITQVLKITQSHFVIRGEGPDKTILFFPKSLSEVVGPGKGNAPSDSWSWSGGFISLQGDNEDAPLVKVVASAHRGDTQLTLGSVTGLNPGKDVRLWESDEDGTLGQTLYEGKAPSPPEFINHKVIDFSFKILSVKNNTIVIDRPLRVDVRLEWNPILYSDEPTITDVGIENLSIEFPAIKYAGHHDEPGYNGFDFSRISHAWIRHVTIINADSGIFLREGTKFCTIQDICLKASAGRARMGYGSDLGEPQSVQVEGHHGILITGASQDNLVTGFRIEARYIHELGVENAAAGNVFSAGSGQDIAFDHHRRAPYENLFTDIDVGAGSHLWENGGDVEDGLPSGVRETFWNIRARQPQTLPPWAIQVNIIGMTTKTLSNISNGDNWVEVIAPDNLTPPNLYLAQHAAKK